MTEAATRVSHVEDPHFPNSELHTEPRARTRAELRGQISQLLDEDRLEECRARLTELAAVPGTPSDRATDLVFLAHFALHESRYHEGLRLLAEAERVLSDPFVDLGCTGLIAHTRGLIHSASGEVGDARVFLEQAWGFYRGALTGMQRSMGDTTAPDFSKINGFLRDLEDTLASEQFGGESLDGGKSH